MKERERERKRARASPSNETKKKRLSLSLSLCAQVGSTKGKRSRDVLIAANKVDLLPLDAKKGRVQDWVRDACRNAIPALSEIKLDDIHLVSCRTGDGVSALVRSARDLAPDPRHPPPKTQIL